MSLASFIGPKAEATEFLLYGVVVAFGLNQVIGSMAEATEFLLLRYNGCL